MIKLIKPLVYSGLLVLVGLSCKVKDRNQDTAAGEPHKKASIARLLAGDEYKAWAIESFTVNGEDQLTGLNACQLDNVDIYYRNFVFEAHEGESRCKTDDPEIKRRGKWTLNADSTIIEVKLGRDIHTLIITGITEDNLSYRSDENGKVTEIVLKATDFKPDSAKTGMDGQ